MESGSGVGLSLGRWAHTREARHGTGAVGGTGQPTSTECTICGPASPIPPPRALYSHHRARFASPVHASPPRHIGISARSTRHIASPPPSPSHHRKPGHAQGANPDKRCPGRGRHGFPGGLLGAGAPEAAAPPPAAAGVHPPLPPLGVRRRGARRPAGSRGRPPGAAAGPPAAAARRRRAGAGPAAAGGDAAAPAPGVPGGAGDGHRGGPPRGAVRRAGAGAGARRLRGVPERHRRPRRGAAAQQLPPRLPPGLPRPLDGARPAHVPALPRAAHPRRDGRRALGRRRRRPRRLRLRLLLPRRAAGARALPDAAAAARAAAHRPGRLPVRAHHRPPLPPWGMRVCLDPSTLACLLPFRGRDGDGQQPRQRRNPRLSNCT
uniref:Uncharacterized protein n=1 Tax=Zea mays TaxID=4577 RepID=A0A804MBH7_MAIZE